jgi:hypothetical protein
MYPLAFLAVAVLPAAPLPPTKASRDLAALEKKLHGTWVGEAACQGNLALRVDGTYERTGVGPGGNTSSGTWTVRWDALPPTLVLTCKEADDPDDVRPVEVRIVQLDDGKFAFAYPDAPKASRPLVYSREKT